MTTPLYKTLNTGYHIPQMGLGVYLMAPGQETYEAVRAALHLGYRHIDTAHAYQNEASVGQAIADSGLNREEIFITTKLWPTEYGEQESQTAIDKMLNRLQTDYIDLLLLHQSIGDYIGAYKGMEAAVKAGKVRSIGLSNFEDERLDEVLTKADIKPAALQVEAHPYFPQDDLAAHIAPYGTVLESWYPLGHGDPALLNEAVVLKIAECLNKTPAQVILRWHLQKGYIVFPKTTNPVHMAENFNIFDITLTTEDMTAIATLNSGKRYFTMSMADREKNFMAYVSAD
ncbi:MULTISPECIES: aldo/keto reductase [unclassified Streptococcus]|uniref:aldo/keto reductase n=1 Tax=unclassified Streptococcus TaxID=2608887 RepID=UPI00359CC67F